MPPLTPSLPSESTGEIMHNVVALETNPTSGTCSANFKNVVSATGEGPYGGRAMGWGLCWGARRP